MPLEASPAPEPAPPEELFLQSHKSKMDPPTFSSSSKPIPIIRKNVSFHNQVAMRPIPSVESFSKAEKKAAWHSVNDLSAMKSRERALRNKSTSSILRDALKQEIGIESTVEVQKRRLRVDLRLCKVLDEQDRQWDNSTDNPDEIARISSITSQESMELAFKRAQDVAKQIDRTNVKSHHPPMTRVGRSAGMLMGGKRRSSDLLSKFTGGLGSSSSSSPKRNATWRIQNGSSMMNTHKSNATWKVTTSTTTGGFGEDEIMQEDDITDREEDDDPALYNPVGVVPPQQQNPRIKSILRSSKVAPVFQSSPALLATSTTGSNNRLLQRPTPTRPHDRLNAISKPTSSLSSSSNRTTMSNGSNSMSNQQWNVTSSPTKSPSGSKPKYDLQKLAGLVGVPSPA